MSQTITADRGVDNAIADVHPRLRHDVVFADTGDGVFLQHSDGGFVLRGQWAYRWVSTLAPHLNGAHSVQELCAGLSEQRRAMVEHLLGTLLERGFLRDSRPVRADRAGPAGQLPDAVAQRFAAQVNFIDHYADDAAGRFQHFRTARVLLTGDGPTAVAVATGLLRNGLARLDLLLPDGAPVPAELSAEAEALRAAGCPAAVHAAHPPADGSPVTGYDVVVALEEYLGLGGIRDLATGCGPDGPALLPAIVVGRLAVLGPTVQPGQFPCWTCALLRLGDNLDPVDAADLWRRLALAEAEPAEQWPGGPVAQMLGNALAFDVFRSRTGCLPAETAGAVVVQDLDTLEATGEVLLAHPACPRCARSDGNRTRELVADLRTVPDVPEAPDAPELDQATVLERHATLFGWYTGVFAEYDDTAIEHSPLKVGRVRIGTGRRRRQVVGFDVHTAFGARLRAGTAAILAYVEPTEQPEHHHSLINGEAGWSATGSLDGSSGGAGAGVTRQEAVLAGLHAALAEQGLRAALSGVDPAVPLARCPIEGPGDDAELAFLLRCADRLEITVDLLRLPGAQPGRAVLAVGAPAGSDDRPLWTVGTGVSEPDAVRVALRDLVGVRQLTLAGADQVDLGGAPVRDLDPRAVPVAVGDPRPVDPAVHRTSDLLAWFAARGEDVLAVDTTPRDLQGAGLVTVRIRLARPDSP